MNATIDNAHINFTENSAKKGEIIKRLTTYHGLDTVFLLKIYMRFTYITGIKAMGHGFTWSMIPCGMRMMSGSLEAPSMIFDMGSNSRRILSPDYVLEPRKLLVPNA